ncbi:MAG: M48 family metallopeptidase [Oligoflexia bacterium]|nr:M48 family metallopeptidase [Oligoflexia bacterium]
MKRSYLARSFFALTLLCVCSCAPHRQPVPPGVVPQQGSLSAGDEEYGHQVMSGLMDQYKLERDDTKIERVRNIVERLTKAAGADFNPWHVYVFDDPKFKNAAATKGNYIFVWSGILNAVQNDAELSAILAHEIGHVLAGHTEPDPADEISQILSGVAGTVAHDVVLSQGGGLAAELARMMISEGLKAVIVNPESQRKELEADEIGIFLMADAGYDPQAAVDFWSRARTDPDFSGFPVQFLSSHPSSDERLKNLSQYLDAAELRYVGKSPASGHASNSESHAGSAFEVRDRWATIYAAPDVHSEVVIDLPELSAVTAQPAAQGWLKVLAPVQGYVKTREMQKR